MVIRSNSLNDVNSMVAVPVLEKVETGIETEKVERVATSHFSDSEEEISQGFELINKVDSETDPSMVVPMEEEFTFISKLVDPEMDYAKAVPSRYKQMEIKIGNATDKSIKLLFGPITSFLEKAFPLPEDTE